MSNSLLHFLKLTNIKKRSESVSRFYSKKHYVYLLSVAQNTPKTSTLLYSDPPVVNVECPGGKMPSKILLVYEILVQVVFFSVCFLFWQTNVINTVKMSYIQAFIKRLKEGVVVFVNWICSIEILLSCCWVFFFIIIA